MSTESTIVVAIVLAVIIVAAGFGLITGAIDIFNDGTQPFKDNITTSQSSSQSDFSDKPYPKEVEVVQEWERQAHRFSL
jgi:hypothetical protein